LRAFASFWTITRDHGPRVTKRFSRRSGG
jgi:hypothetical protein